MTTTVRSTIAGVLLLTALTACDGVVTAGGANERSLVSIYLTDAPGDVEAVWVDVEEIYLQGGSEGRVVLLDEPTGLIELTSLAGTTSPLVTDAEVEVATYGQLRFVIGGAVLETKDGSVYSKDGAEHPDGLETTGELHCPSCSQAGIKVLLKGEDLEIEGEAEDFLLDFDVTQSFGRQAGRSGRWVMHPVIHGVRMIEMGSIEGTVAVATDQENEPAFSIPDCPDGTPRGLEDFVPTATAVTLTDGEGEPIVRTGMTDEEGAFRIGGLAPDEYELGYQAEIVLDGATLVWTADVDPADITVGAGDHITGVEFTITDVVCEVENEG